jgi:hypothetical protein
MTTELSTGQQALELQKAQASLLAQSQFLPKHYSNRPADCLVAIQWAQRTGLDPLELLQNTFVVHGTPGMKASYMIGLANKRGPFEGPIRFRVEGTGDDMVAYAWGVIDGEEYTASASMKMAKAEGWSKNKKYTTMPELMLQYRAATFLVRLYCPEVLSGMPTSDEVEDLRFAEATVVESAPLAELAADLSGEEPTESGPEEQEQPVVLDTEATVVEPHPDADLFEGALAAQVDPE